MPRIDDVVVFALACVMLRVATIVPATAAIGAVTSVSTCTAYVCACPHKIPPPSTDTWRTFSSDVCACCQAGCAIRAHGTLG